MKPGMTMSPSASITSAPSAAMFGRTSAILSPSTRTSARGSSPSCGSCVRTVPPRTRIRSATRYSLSPPRNVRSLLLRRSRLVSGAALPSPGADWLRCRARPSSPEVLRDQRKVAVTTLCRRSGEDEIEVDACLRDRDAERIAEGRDEPQVLGGKVERERGRCRLGLEEGSPLVADERRPGGGSMKDVVGGRPLDPGSFREDKRLGQPDVEREDDGVDGELHRGARADRPDVRDPGRDRVEYGPCTLERLRVAADHHRELPTLGEADAAGDRCVEQRPATRTDQGLERLSDLRLDRAHVDHH